MDDAVIAVVLRRIGMTRRFPVVLGTQLITQHACIPHCQRESLSPRRITGGGRVAYQHYSGFVWMVHPGLCAIKRSEGAAGPGSGITLGGRVVLHRFLLIAGQSCGSLEASGRGCRVDRIRTHATLALSKQRNGLAQ